MKNWINIDLNCLIDLASRIGLAKLFNCVRQKGKEEYLKLSILQEHLFKLCLFAAQV